MQIILTVVLISELILSTFGQTYLRANGQTNTYGLINSVLGGNAVETSDCAHSAFGPHITQTTDSTLNRPVFVFHAHVKQDNDNCQNFDRQRTEIKTYNPSPAYLKGYNGETVTLSWNFHLNSNFQPSSSFTHIHQLKAVDGDAGSPIITLTPRYKSNGNILELIHVNSRAVTTRLKTISLNDVVGKWIHVREQISYGSKGKYSITISNLQTGAIIMNYSNNSLDLWRNGATFVRPKWGIYRSLTKKEQLKDEQVKFDTFCLAKGNDNCV